MSEATTPANLPSPNCSGERPQAERRRGRLSGKVLSIDDDHVQVDIGFKSEGLVAAWEFMDDDGTMLVQGPGDTVDV